MLQPFFFTPRYDMIECETNHMKWMWNKSRDRHIFMCFHDCSWFFLRFDANIATYCFDMSWVVVRPQWLLLSSATSWPDTFSRIAHESTAIVTIWTIWFWTMFWVRSQQVSTGLISWSWWSWGAWLIMIACLTWPWWSTTCFYTGTGNLLISFVRCVPTDETFRQRPRDLDTYRCSFLECLWQFNTII